MHFEACSQCMAAAIVPEHHAEPGKGCSRAAHMKVVNNMRNMRAASAAVVDAFGGFHTWYGRTKSPNHMDSWRDADPVHYVWDSAA